MGEPRRAPVHICSHRRVAVLAPVTKPAVAGLAVNSVANGTVPHGDGAAACSISGGLQGLAAQLALRGKGDLRGGQVKQPLSTVAAHDGGFLDGALGEGHGDDGGNSGAGETVGAVHDPQGVVGASSAPVFKL